MTKELIINQIKTIQNNGWVENYRNMSNGNVGNIFEDLMGIEENNFSLPDIGEYEIKTQRIKCQPVSLLTLCHIEPEPRSLKVVPYLLENFGWAHTNGIEKSFRQTITTKGYSEKGFKVRLDKDKISVEIENKTISFTEPYWLLSELEIKLKSKLKNQINVLALEKDNKFKYVNTVFLENFKFDKFIDMIESGHIYIDFNARTKHNHGTSFRIKQTNVQFLYETIGEI